MLNTARGVDAYDVAEKPLGTYGSALDAALAVEAAAGAP
jgi:hypothetical protein